MVRRLFLFFATLATLTTAHDAVQADVRAQFVRGDVNIDGVVNVADPIALIQWLLVPGAGSPPDCADSADANDDGAIDMADAIYSLSAQFLAGAPPFPAPGSCGLDPTDDGLDCEVFSMCPTVVIGVDLVQFVFDRFAETSDTTEPTMINGIDFCAVDDPTAFDLLICP